MLKTQAGKNDSTARLVLVSLAEVGRGDPIEAFPSLARLRYVTGLDMKTVQRALQRLEEAGLIKESGRRGEGVVVWQLMTDVRRPETDKGAIDAEVEEHRERDRQRKRKAPDSGALRPEVPDFTSGVQGVESGIQGAKSGIPDAEPARAGKRTGNEPVTLTAVPAADSAKPKRTRHGYTQDFENWWAFYPRSTDKHAASKKFTAALKLTDLYTLMDGVRRYATEVEGRLPDHIKHAATWLNGRCWENGKPVPERDAAEAATEWVRAEWKAGRVKPIQDRTGLHFPSPDLPLNVTGSAAIEQFYATAAREWIAANHDQIIERLTHRSAS